MTEGRQKEELLWERARSLLAGIRPKPRGVLKRRTPAQRAIYRFYTVFDARKPRGRVPTQVSHRIAQPRERHICTTKETGRLGGLAIPPDPSHLGGFGYVAAAPIPAMAQGFGPGRQKESVAVGCPF